MGNCCWTQCFGRLRREAGRLRRGGGSKYFRTCSRGEHLTIEFENLVESDEGESPGSSHRPLTEEEIVDLRERHYDSIAEKQKDLDMKIQRELALREEKLRLEEEALYAAQREAARAARRRKLSEERHRAVQQSHPSNGGEHQRHEPNASDARALENGGRHSPGRADGRWRREAREHRRVRLRRLQWAGVGERLRERRGGQQWQLRVRGLRQPGAGAARARPAAETLTLRDPPGGCDSGQSHLDWTDCCAEPFSKRQVGTCVVNAR
ncbi:PREDICTED: AP-1 complex-associated regulatory protein isoform X4 [Hipposideros armiger]|uniref:AP-1 complex-associated regulatory protein isoform X4 n=1 Tax=Hipposideros armiger TaxID=186990 RepID=A0A8B7SJK3_HIPAR|nr:PREDICTED: AP-1 complex-associated regulatory protein isoform X4 [Hipposideros armiger]